MHAAQGQLEEPARVAGVSDRENARKSGGAYEPLKHAIAVFKRDRDHQTFGESCAGGISPSGVKDPRKTPLSVNHAVSTLRLKARRSFPNSQRRAFYARVCLELCARPGGCFASGGGCGHRPAAGRVRLVIVAFETSRRYMLLQGMRPSRAGGASARRRASHPRRRRARHACEADNTGPIKPFSAAKRAGVTPSSGSASSK